MNTIVLNLIRKRNPAFSFDSNVSFSILLGFILQQSFNMLRGLKLLFYFKNPKMALFGPHVKLVYPSKITLGKHLKLGRNVVLQGLGKEGIILGNNVSLGDYSKLVVSTSLHHIGAYIKLGNNVGIGEFAYLGGAGGLEIGDDTIVGQYLSCHPENHVIDDLETPIRHQGVTRKGIKIGQNCWIGSKVTILDGVTIGDGCVIAAGAIVTKSFPNNSIIGGVPAKIIHKR